VHNSSHAVSLPLCQSVRCERWIGPPWFHARPARYSSAGLPPVGAGASSAPGRDDPAVLGDDAPSEVRRVELHAPDGLVHGPQVGQGERRSDERGRDARDLELDANTLDRVAHDLEMVECQVDLSVEQIGDRDQRGGRSIRACLDGADVAQHGQVRDR
jgi:hypothetical protein